MNSGSADRPRRGDLILTLVLLAVFVGAYLLSLAWSFRAALFPRLLSATGAVLAVLQLAALAVQARRAAVASPTEHQVDHAEPAGEDEDNSLEYVFASAGSRAWRAALAWIGGFFVSLWLLGAVPTVPLFALLYLRFTGNASWLAAAVYAAVAGAVISIVFGRLLSIPMPAGVF